MAQNLMEKVAALCKRRGFVFPGSEIYGGFANSYSYGPYGTELKNNIKKLWWKKFVHDRPDIVGIDGPILLHPKLWEASGHVSGFNDALVDCKKCKKRFRADHLVEEATGQDHEGNLKELSRILKEHPVKCPSCGSVDWTDARNFNMMFKTEMNGIVNENGDPIPVYLRPETAGAIFMEFKNVVDSMRVKVPFGIAQIGKAFRNEIIAGNFIFRLREFEQMEIEYFIHPKVEWEPLFEQWLELQEEFALEIGLKKEDISRYEHPKEKLSHYSKKTVDTMYKFPFGVKELYGIAHRTDFDLSQHAKFSGEKLEYFDQGTSERYVPHVLEPTFGVDRSFLAAILAAYNEEEIEGETRVVLKFPPKIAPVQIAIFPLIKKEGLTKLSQEIFANLKKKFSVEYDESGSIGKRYRRQDEIGTPFCITVDFDTIEKDNKVTIRDRDSTKQERVAVDQIESYLTQKLW